MQLRPTFANRGVADASVGLLVEEGRTPLTVSSHGVMQTVVAHTAADVARRQEHRHVKVATAGVAVAVALCDKKDNIKNLSVFVHVCV